MKATELLEKPYFKGLVYGDSGVGKTCWAAQFPGPMEYWDFDHKFSSAVQFLKSRKLEAKLADIDVYQFGQLPVKERIPAWEKRTNLINYAILTKSPLPFKTLVLDSITTLSHHLMEDYIFRSQTALKRPVDGINGLQDYQLYEKHMTRVLTTLLAQDINLIVLGHIDVDKDEVTGQITRKPLCKGQQLSKALPVWFEEVYVAVAKPDGNRVFITQPNNTYSIVRCQRGLAKEIPMQVEQFLK